MSYQLTETNNYLAIEEAKYATAPEVRTTKFTSCIGVVGFDIMSGDKAICIHLVLNYNGQTFDTSVADQAINLLDDYGMILVIGAISFWENSESSQVRDGYKKLIEEIKKIDPDAMTWEVGDGYYGGRLQGTKYYVQQVNANNTPDFYFSLPKTV